MRTVGAKNYSVKDQAAILVVKLELVKLRTAYKLSVVRLQSKIKDIQRKHVVVTDASLEKLGLLEQ
jgi:hypothetical protein